MVETVPRVPNSAVAVSYLTVVLTLEMPRNGVWVICVPLLTAGVVLLVLKLAAMSKVWSPHGRGKHHLRRDAPHLRAGARLIKPVA